MARFSGQIGFGRSVKKTPGSWEDEITEKPYMGDVIRDNRLSQDTEKVNSDISLSVQISVLANNYAIKNLQFIKYVRWEGVAWVVTEVEPKRPRLILSLGGVYNGPTSGTAGSS